ncbi:unnamed protein product [Allacma fusca]|uniref:Peptidase M14 domain-containing protein n=1 Tax=Allacma fusca TaxID=39272 RepID=A0A8J2K4Y0_9HEXA|nr:unnamed protein product [Allacma fusca]
MTLCQVVIILVLLFNCNYFTSADDSEFSSERETAISEENLKSTCHHEDVTRYLNWVAIKYSSVARLVSIGNSTQGRELWTIIISEDSTSRRLLKPQVKFVGNLNGFSGPACVLLIKLIKFLLENYDTDAELKHLIDKAEVHIIPNMNPDGYAKSLPGECFKKDGRLNANGVDLNRNFPDIFHPHDDHEDDPPLEMETKAMMGWIKQNNFIVSASFISGAQVVSYPYDTSPQEGYVQNTAHETPDDETFQFLARNYVGFVNEQHNTTDWNCPTLKRQFQGGIINGAEWHSVSGTMMDFNYNSGVFELLIGVSCCRNDNNPKNLEHIWRINKFAMISLIREAEYSFRGQVVDSETNEPMSNVEVCIFVDRSEHLEGEGPPMPFFTNSRGELWRVLLPGRYRLKAFFKNYITKAVPFEISMEGPLELRIEMDSKGKRRRLRNKQVNGVLKPDRFTESSPHHQQILHSNDPFFDDIEAARVFEEIRHLVNHPRSNMSAETPDSDFHELEAFPRTLTVTHNGKGLEKNTYFSVLIAILTLFVALS